MYYSDRANIVVSRHVEVWRLFEDSITPQRVIQRLELMPLCSYDHRGPQRMTQKEYAQSIYSLKIELLLETDEFGLLSVQHSRALGLDSEGKYLFYAAGGRTGSVIILSIFEIQWGTGEGTDGTRTIQNIILARKVSFGQQEIPMLTTMEMAE